MRLTLKSDVGEEHLEVTRHDGRSSARRLPISHAASAWIAPRRGDDGAIARGAPSINSYL